MSREFRAAKGEKPAAASREAAAGGAGGAEWRGCSGMRAAVVQPAFGSLSAELSPPSG